MKVFRCGLVLASMTCSLAVVAGTTPLALVPQPQKVAKGNGVSTCTNIIDLTDAKLPPEGYRISVTPKAVKVWSAEPAGAFYARQTLRQLAQSDEQGGVTYPCVEIEDAPRFAWRGVLLDECRHFFGKETVKKLLDLMAQHKFNTLQWHLTDDQGWRLDIPGKPELVRNGATRLESVCHDNPKKTNGESYGPFFYTEKDVREILDYAAARQIRIIPEIELPGHVRSLLASHPEFACQPKNIKSRYPRVVWGIEKEVLCLGNDKAIAYMEEVLDYVCRLFPSDIINIGGDECPSVRWKKCPKCSARMKAEGLKNEHALQPWATRHFADFLASRGKRVAGWSEYLQGDVPQDAIGILWKTGKFLTPQECVERGHGLVMAPNVFCYLDASQGLKDDPFEYLGTRVTTLEKVYSFDPCAEITPDLRGRVLGGQACNWAECTWNVYDLEWKMWPRACALAEVFWTGEQRPGFADFKARMAVHRPRLLRQHVNCAPLGD